MGSRHHSASTNHGDVPVDAVKIDDEVLSRNRESGKLEYERVTALTLPHKDKLVSLTIEGEREPLRPATDHPFWVRRGYADLGSWITAGQMRVGDFVQTTQGNWRRVIAVTPAPHEQTVYNFTVDKDHDYFVGQTGFLVHNAGPCGCKYRRPYIQKWVREEVADKIDWTEDG